jgi:hypothetical protein
MQITRISHRIGSRRNANTDDLYNQANRHRSALSDTLIIKIIERSDRKMKKILTRLTSRNEVASFNLRFSAAQIQPITVQGIAPMDQKDKRDIANSPAAGLSHHRAFLH